MTGKKLTEETINSVFKKLFPEEIIDAAALPIKFDNFREKQGCTHPSCPITEMLLTRAERIETKIRKEQEAQ